MSNDKFVVGVKFDHPGGDVTLYIQGNYRGDFASLFAQAISHAKYYAQGDPDRFRSEVIEQYLGYGNYRLTAVPVHTDHTLQILDVNRGKVILMAEDYQTVKVEFTIPDYLARYNK